MERSEQFGGASLSVAFGDVLAALKLLGGAAHADMISQQVGAAKSVAPRERFELRSAVRELLAQQEALDGAPVRRAFGEGSNRWVLA